MTSARKDILNPELLRGFVLVPEPIDAIMAKHRKVNGTDADSIPKIVVAAISSYYGGGAYPIHWEPEAGAYVMESQFYHIEITATERTAIVRFWPNDMRIDYSKAKPTSTRRYAFRRKAG